MLLLFESIIYFELFTALKIQLSSASKELLDEFPAYEVEERGEIMVKVIITPSTSLKFVIMKLVELNLILFFV